MLNKAKIIHFFKNKTHQKIALIFIIWYVAIFVLANYLQTFDFSDLGIFYIIFKKPWVPNLPEFLKPFASWDSNWYQAIVEEGYSIASWDPSWYKTALENGASITNENLPSIVFFPLYPILLWITKFFTANNPLISGIILSFFLSLYSAFIYYKIALFELKSKSKSFFALLLLLLFPFSFFLTTVYSESLFLALALTVFYAASQKKWWLVGIAGALASATRPTGILLLPAAGLYYLEGIEWQIKNIKKDILWLLLMPIGLLSFMAFLWISFGRPLGFAEAQEIWGRITEPSIDSIIYTIEFYSSVWQLNHEYSYRYITDNLNVLSFLFAFILGIIIFFKERKSYGFFILASIIIPALTANLISMGRFVLVLFPLYIYLAKYTNKVWVRLLLITIFAPLLVLVITHFVNDMWIA